MSRLASAMFGHWAYISIVGLAEAMRTSWRDSAVMLLSTTATGISRTSSSL